VLLGEVLSALRGHTVAHELVVADSGSTDGSLELALSFGARVVPVERFSHGGTRNLLMERTGGEQVAFLTQDAVPSDARWLERLRAGFALADDVALVYGPSRPRPDAPVPVARELSAWFASLAARQSVVRDVTARGPSPETFFSSANCAVLRSAWERVPFRDVPYAEDQALALDMLHAGYAKAFTPEAAVVHSHAYRPLAQFRRTFDEWRALRDIHGFTQPLAPVSTVLDIQSQVRADVRAGSGPVRSVRHWTVRALGAAVGSRADRLPERVRRWCSLERRA
jgi:glycosyltransferase involved in cell wall biosynthesis